MLLHGVVKKRCKSQAEVDEYSAEFHAQGLARDREELGHANDPPQNYPIAHKIHNVDYTWIPCASPVHFEFNSDVKHTGLVNGLIQAPNKWIAVVRVGHIVSILPDLEYVKAFELNEPDWPALRSHVNHGYSDNVLQKGP